MKRDGYTPKRTHNRRGHRIGSGLRKCLHNHNMDVADCPHYECTIHYAIWDSRARKVGWSIADVRLLYLILRPCVDCGERDPRVLEFDHVPGRGGKLFKVSDPPNGATLADVMAEITKCEVVCGNCHSIRGKSRSREPYTHISKRMRHKLNCFLLSIDAPALGEKRGLSEKYDSVFLE